MPYGKVVWLWIFSFWRGLSYALFQRITTTSRAREISSITDKIPVVMTTFFILAYFDYRPAFDEFADSHGFFKVRV